MTGDRGIGLIDPARPVNWRSPLNRGLAAWWMVVPNSGWRGGLTFRDLLGKNHGTLTNGPTWRGGTRPGGFGCLSFDGSDDYVATALQLQNLWSTAGTIAWSAKPANAFNGATVDVFWGQISGTTAPEFSAQKYSDGNFYVGFNAAGSDQRVVLAASAANYAQNEWQRYAVTWTSGGTTTLYRNGLQIAVNGGTTTPRSPSNTFDIARMPLSPAVYFSGQQDDLAIWSRALSAGDVAQNYAASRTGYRNELNWLRRGSAATTGAAAGGGTLVFGGSMAMSGSLAKAIAKPMTGSFSLAGLLSRLTNKPLSGAVTTAGALTRATAKSYTGSVTPAGILTRQAGKPLSGTVSTSGALAKQAGKPFAAAITAAGALSKATAKAFSGTVTPGGTFSPLRVLIVAFTGAVSLGGTLTKATAKGLAAAVTVGGSLLKRITKSFIGTITPSGNLTRGGPSTGGKAAWYYRLIR